jgi:hypothetical protein
VASAKDTLGNRAYKRVIFGTGSIAPIGTLGPETLIVGSANETLFQQAALQGAINTQIQTLVEQRIQKVLVATPTEIQNAFIVGLSDEGTQTLFNELCTQEILFEGEMMTPGEIFQKKVKESIEALDDGGITIYPSVPCTDDPDVSLTISNVSVGDQITCNVDFNDGNFVVTMGLPNIHVDVHAYGTGGGWDDFICVAGVKIEGDAYSDITNISLQFTVTEDNLLNNTFSAANFDGGLTASSNGTVSVDFCGLSEVCDVIVTIFTLGAVDLTDIDFSIVENVDFSEAVGANQPDPVKLNEIKVDEQVVATRSADRRIVCRSKSHPTASAPA